MKDGGYFFFSSPLLLAFGTTCARADLPDTLKVGLFAADPSDGPAPIGDFEGQFDNFSIISLAGLARDPIPADGTACVDLEGLSLSWVEPKIPGTSYSVAVGTEYENFIALLGQFDIML